MGGLYSERPYPGIKPRRASSNLPPHRRQVMGILRSLRYSFRWVFQPHFIAGERAERLFEELCEAEGYVLEKISQDRKGFAKYAAGARNRIKRGDYIVRNLRNAEVEVKCFSPRRYRRTACYAIKYRHIKGHEEMARFTGAPVIFAIFERSGRNVIVNSLRMMPLSELTPPSRRRRAVFYNERIKSLCIPLEVMYLGFRYFAEYKSRIERVTPLIRHLE